MNVLQIIPDSFLGVPWTAITNYQISCGPKGYLVCNMALQNKLPIIPINSHLTKF